MLEIHSLRTHVPGIKGALLARDRKVLAIHIEPQENKRSLTRIMYWLFEGLYGRHKDPCSVCTAENDRFFLFFHNFYELGVIASQDVDVALLKDVVDQELGREDVVLEAMDTE
jgi:hypothetical protein